MDRKNELTYLLKMCCAIIGISIVLFTFMALNMVDVLIILIVGIAGIIGVGALALWLDDRSTRHEYQHLERQREQRERVALALAREHEAGLEPFDLDPKPYEGP